MTTIEEIKDILHQEQLKEDSKHIGIPSWNRQFNKLATKLGHGDLAKPNYKKITEYNQDKKIQAEFDTNHLELYFLKRARNQLIWLCLYPLALLISLFAIYNL